MALDVLGHVIELVFGPVFLVIHIPELSLAIGDLSGLVGTLLDGGVGTAVNQVLAGQYDVGTKTLASLIGTVLWLALVAGALGELGEVGELFELFG